MNEWEITVVKRKVEVFFFFFTAGQRRLGCTGAMQISG
jgi:hypothetical protein